MATPVGAVFLLEGIISVLYSFLQVKTLLRFSDGRCLRFVRVGFARFPPSNRAYVRFLGPVFPQKLGQVSSS
jgi:hypothetical protein